MMVTPETDQSIAERIRRDVLGADRNLPPLIAAIKQDPSFKIYDFMSEETYRIDIGPIEPELELDLFNSIRVSAQIPFVVVNHDRHKVENFKGRYVSRDRKFKICHNVDSNYDHSPFIARWADDNKLNIPHTLIMKILPPQTSNSKIEDRSYINAIYRFGDGFYIVIPKSKRSSPIQQVVDTLNNHLTNFKATLSDLTNITGEFVLDNVVLNAYTFRSFLMQPISFNQPYPLHFWPFLWLNERDKALSLRSQFILHFELGDIRARIVVSEETSKRNDKFYQDGIPIHFKIGETYNSISISDVQKQEHVLLIRDIILLAAYLYGNNNGSGISNSQAVAAIIQRFVPAAERFVAGDVKGPSKEIDIDYLFNTTGYTPNARNKQLDPTYYGEIATTTSISNRTMPASIRMTTREPNWQQKLYAMMVQEPNVQVIRYPLKIEGLTEFDDTPVTIMPPYFLFATAKSPYIKPRLNHQPMGDDNTHHPFLFTVSKSSFIQTPGNDTDSRFIALADLTKPFVVNYWKGEKSKSSHEMTTIKILPLGSNGHVPIALETVLSRQFRGIQFNDISGNIHTADTMVFRRAGSVISTATLIHVLVAATTHRANLREAYTMFAGNVKAADEYIQRVVRPMIVNSLNWNVGRQEFYDWTVEEAKAYFLDERNHVDSRIFRTILERFFNAYIMIIDYDRENVNIEVPRHKFCYYPSVHPANAQTFVIFKHSGAKSLRTPQPHYETISMISSTAGAENFLLPWEIARLKILFNLENRTVDSYFSTIYRNDENKYQTGNVVTLNAEQKPALNQLFKIENLQYQFVDGAGKLRAFVHSHTANQRITVCCEPLVPLELDCFDDIKALTARRDPFRPEQFLEAEDFEMAIQFVQSLGIALESINYHIESESLMAIEIDQQPDDETLRLEAERKRLADEAKKQQQAARREELKLSILERAKLAQSNSSSSLLLPPPSAVMPTAQQRKRLPTTRKVIRKVNTEPMAIGIWFTISNVKFYIPTTAGVPKTEKYGINNEPYFRVEPDNVFFRFHDELERIANVLVQIIRNLYIYSRLEDVDAFMAGLIVIDPEVIYNIDNVQRRIPTPRNFVDDLAAYARIFPTFFKQVDNELKLVLDSQITFKRLRQHLKMVQTLKENIVGASGSRFAVTSGPGEVRTITYAPYIDGAYRDHRKKLDDEMIAKLPRMDKFFNRPGYIIEFFSYASDFTRRGPDQNVFMSQSEVQEYVELIEMEKKPEIVYVPLPDHVRISKSMMYFAAADGSLYIIQNVSGRALRRVLNILKSWEEERVNLGYFAQELDEDANDVYQINVADLDKLDTAQYYVLLTYEENQYAALLKVEGSVTYSAAI